jgi:hypothetical protein
VEPLKRWVGHGGLLHTTLYMALLPRSLRRAARIAYQLPGGHV